jgi:DNA invertase Pin-like site-specific DNA recombinase
MRRIISYIRVSTSSRASRAWALRQRDAIPRFMAAEGFELIGEFVEVETGKGCDAQGREVAGTRRPRSIARRRPDG